MPKTDISTIRRQTRARVRRHREKLRERKLTELRGLNLSDELLTKARLASLFTPGRNVSDLITRATVLYLEKTQEDTTKLLRLICMYWPRIRVYSPYLKRLALPCPPIVVHGVQYTHDEASRLLQIDAEIRRQMRLRGVTAIDDALNEMCELAKDLKLFSDSEIKPILKASQVIP